MSPVNECKFTCHNGFIRRFALTIKLRLEVFHFFVQHSVTHSRMEFHEFLSINVNVTPTNQKVRYLVLFFALGASRI